MPQEPPEVRVWADAERADAGTVWIGAAQVRVRRDDGRFDTHFFEFGARRFGSRTEAEAHAECEVLRRLGHPPASGRADPAA